ncbi:cysteine desulfurase family protein [Thermaerobacter subterraneus]|uniref:Cysteine desulfurase family protein n=1 Tax=Thermaerobacter subterraneus DSM 13965 TaxID=867903 RepID=K6PS91_9FIRM|nr:cysteine desulfurase family protein [Thermaerobacter subterraneus]EKP95837.1 cysteine desulfurase family protein [Thermaerobacter subterraneus DSM 13965]
MATQPAPGTSPGVYLDNAATTRARPEVVEAMVDALQNRFGNPASLHTAGLEAERLVKEARAVLARALDVPADDLYFTSGGTEANNWALRGMLAAYPRRGRHLVTTAIEHSSILTTARRLEEEGYRLTVVPADGRGRVDPERVAAAVAPDTVLVSVMLVNNEIGSIQPIADIVQAVRRRRPEVLVHVDAVQAFGKMPVRPRAWGVDLLTVSAHKIHGPKGTGALYVRRGVRIQPLLTGGEQEGGLRPGTHNVPGIAGFGVAARLILAEQPELGRRLQALKERLVERVQAEIPEVYVNGPDPAEGAPHIVNLSVVGARGEVLVHALAQRGVYVSTGSACTSRRTAPSHVLQALGLPPARLDSALRVSLGRETTEGDVERFVAALREAAAEVRAVASVRARH